jgi:hypothetical protein
MFLKCPTATPSSSASVSRSAVDSDCQYDLKVMRHYHQKVTTKATPFGEFTKRCQSDEMAPVEDIQKLRRERLRAYIKANAKSVNAFALALGRQASFFSDLLRGEKSFREKLVEKLEEEVSKKGWPPIGLTDLNAEQPQKIVPFAQSWPVLPTVTRKQYDDLPKPVKDQILGYMEGKVAEVGLQANTGKKKVRGY